MYGIDEFAIATPAENGAYPTSFPFKFKAIVQGSLSFNDNAASTTDVEIEDSEDPYAVLTSSAATKGFTVQTYDMSPETYKEILGFTSTDQNGTTSSQQKHRYSKLYRLRQRYSTTSLQRCSNGQNEAYCHP